MLLPNEGHQVFKIVDENCKAILWLHEGQLSSTSPFFNEMNYLSNGLILKSLSSEMSATHLFHSQNFGQPFYIYYCDAGQNDSMKKIEMFMNILKKNEKKDGHIIVIESSGSHHGKLLKSQYSKEHFEILKY